LRPQAPRAKTELKTKIIESENPTSPTSGDIPEDDVAHTGKATEIGHEVPMPSENWQQALTWSTLEEKQQDRTNEPLPETTDSQERLTGVDIGDTPLPLSETRELTQEEETKGSKDIDQVEKG